MNEQNWVDITNRDLTNFIFIIVYMGIVRLPEHYTYWKNSVVGQSFPRRLMSLERFEAIMRNWTWIEINDELRKDFLEMCSSYAVNGFITATSDMFRNHWNLSQFLDIDESCVYD